MRRSSTTGGVCAACRYGSNCIYAAAARRTVLECGQFEAALPLAQVRARTGSSMAAGERLGLCSSCEFRDACIYPKPEGGVWRCEEYR